MLNAQIIFGFIAMLAIPLINSATEMSYGQLATNGFRNQAQVAYVKPPSESKALIPTTITIPDEAKQVLDELFGRNNTKALVVVRDSQILYERYSFGVGKRNTPLGFSISKSLTALAVGRAICDGHITSIEDTVKKYVASLSGTSWGEGGSIERGKLPHTKDSVRHHTTGLGLVSWCLTNSGKKNHALVLFSQMQLLNKFLQPAWRIHMATRFGSAAILLKRIFVL